MIFGGRRDSWRIWMALGLGLCGYGYYEWNRLQVPTPEQLETAVQAQFLIEMARLQEQAGDQPIVLTPDWQQKYLSAIRNERVAPVARAQKRIHSIFAAGLIMLVLAAGMFVYQRLANSPPPASGR